MAPITPITRLVGVFGGTFNPIHYGHLRCAEELAEQIGLSEVRFIPSAQPPHRCAPTVSATQRLAMVELAIADHPNWVADGCELARDRPSYMVETLTELRQQLPPSSALVLLLGSDAFSQLHRWHRWAELLEWAHLVVAERPGSRLKERELAAPLQPLWRQRGELLDRLWSRPAGGVGFLPVTALAISATAIRAAVAAGRSIRYLTPEQVVEFIFVNQCYR